VSGSSSGGGSGSAGGTGRHAPHPAGFPPGAGRQVLLVEDESRLRDMLARAIHEMGFVPTATPQAESALRLMEQRGDAGFDIIVLDLNLPGMGGLELLEQVRSRWPSTQAIVLTGFGDLDAARLAIRLDVVDFLSKPCPLGELEVSLDRARNRRLKATGVKPPITGDLAGDALNGDDDDDSRGGAIGRDSDPRVPAGATAPSLEEVEQRHILAVLEKNHGNRTATAAELGISLRKLYYRLGQYQKQGLIP
jgi:DNA-binding NtrC family response regulator